MIGINTTRDILRLSQVSSRKSQYRRYGWGGGGLFHSILFQGCNHDGMDNLDPPPPPPPPEKINK